MSAFLFGALTSGGLQKMGLMGGRSHVSNSTMNSTSEQSWESRLSWELSWVEFRLSWIIWILNLTRFLVFDWLAHSYFSMYQVIGIAKLQMRIMHSMLYSITWRSETMLIRLKSWCRSFALQLHSFIHACLLTFLPNVSCLCLCDLASSIVWIEAARELSSSSPRWSHEHLSRYPTW